MIYNFTIYPVEVIYKALYLFISNLIGSYGISLILLSITTTLLIFPFMRSANKMQANEKHIQDVLAPQLKKIKSESTGAEQHMRITKLYHRYAYHPVLAVRSAAGVALQIPFLMAAYFMLSSLPNIQGQSFLIINDLSKPDGLLGSINLLPILMTMINLMSAWTMTNFARKDKIQAAVIAFLFLLLLYNAPSALLIFWTFNNFWVLLGNIIHGKRLLSFMQLSLRRFISSYFCMDPFLLLIILIIFTPLIFNLSLNYFIFTLAQIFISVLFCAFLCLFLYLPYFFLKRKTLNKIIIKITTNIILLFCAFWLIFMFNATISPIFPSYKIRIPLYIFILIILPLIHSIFKEKFLIMCFTIYVSLCFFNSIYIIQFKNINATHNVVKKDSRPLIKLKKTPNIYLLIAESLPRPDNIYGLEMNRFVVFLKNKKFTVSNNSYSNYEPTANSKLSLFNQEHHYYKYQKGFAELTQAGKKLLTSTQNFVFKILNYNNYNIYSIGSCGDLEGINEKGDLVKLDTNFRNVSIFEPLLSMSYRLRFLLDRKNAVNLGQRSIDVKIQDYQKINKNLNKILNSETGKPTFCCIFYDNMHEEFSSGKTCEARRDTWLKEYKKTYKLQEEIFMKDINLIISRDPNSIIIILGDHGSRHYAVCRCDPEFNNLSKFMDSHGYTYKKLTEDLFSTMLTIYFKGEKIEDIKSYSHINVFTRIFSKLNNDKSILKYAEPNDSYVLVNRKDVMIAIENNKPIFPWRKIN